MSFHSRIIRKSVSTKFVLPCVFMHLLLLKRTIITLEFRGIESKNSSRARTVQSANLERYLFYSMKRWSEIEAPS